MAVTTPKVVWGVYLSLERKLQAIKLYLEGVGFRGIERLTGIHHTTVIKWVKNLAAKIKKLRPELSEPVLTIELDEMWHFIQNAGSGLLAIEKESAA